MNSYEILGRLTAIVAYASGVAGVAYFVARVRTGNSRSRSASMFAALVVFLLPAGVLFRLLSHPLAEQSPHSLWLHLAILLLCFAAGAVNSFRVFRAGSKRAEPPST
jgi:hypothetical protein